MTSSSTTKRSKSPVEELRKTWHHKYSLTGQFINHDLPPQKALFLMIADIGIFMTSIIIVYWLLHKIFLQPIQRGFYCNDPYINNPLLPNTVPTSTLLLITLAGPFFVVFGSLLLKHCKGDLNVLFNNSRRIISKVSRETAFVYLDYVLAFGILTITLEFMKCGTGRLRPNFFQMCRPDLSICETNPNGYIEDYTCNPILPKYGRNAKMSFPSGHAAASVFAAIFVYYYLRQVFENEQDKGHKLIINFKRICLLFYHTFAILTSISRIWDYWHFPSDVLGGVLTALVFFFVTLRKYSKRRRQQKMNNVEKNVDAST